MSIYVAFFAITLLFLETYLNSQEDRSNKMSLWKSIIISLFWWASIPYYLIKSSYAKNFLTKTVKLIKKLIA